MGISFRNGHFFPFIVAVLIFINGYVKDVDCEPDRMTQIKKLKDKLMMNYDQLVRPMNGSNTTQVFMSVIPRQLIDADEEKALLSLDSFLYMNWIDPRLVWDISEYDGYLQLPSKLIWLPDISVHNSHSLQVDPTQEVLISIEKSGNVFWIPPILTQTTCPGLSQKDSNFLDSEVLCIIKLGSWMHDGWEINFEHSEEMLMAELENVHSRWEVLKKKTRAVRNETYFDCCPEPYLSIDIHFVMKRRPTPAIEATRTPCVLIMVLTLAIFWLPPDSSKKLLLGGFLFLSLNILLVFVGWSTRGPLMVLSAVSFLRTAMFLVVITLLIQVLIVIKIASLTGPSKPPSVIIEFLTGPLGKYACLRTSSSEDKIPLDCMQLKEDATTVERLTAKDEWKLLASGIDRVLFVLMAIVMVAVHHL